jgi:hypothetical protein
VEQQAHVGARTGHRLILSTARAEVWVYENTRAYGHWILWLSPADDEMCARHSLPTRLHLDGGFRDLRYVDQHAWPVDVWGKDPAGCLAPLLGDAIAGDVGPMATLALINFEPDT